MHFTLRDFSALVYCLVLLFLTANAKLGNSSSSVSAIFIFGDSLSDSGTNNYLATVARGNFPPYGRDFVNHTATGRFTNGRLANDFIAEYVGIKKYVPPYLDPTLSIEELMTGVCFASAGSGFDPLTTRFTNVLSMAEQFEQFKEYKAKMEAAIGKDKTMELVNNALYIVSAGTNDFIINYFNIPIRRFSYTIPSYTTLVLQLARQFYQGLLDEGARRIGVTGLLPIGCLPLIISIYPALNPIFKRDCIDSLSSIARNYNEIIQNQLKTMQIQLQPSGSRIAYIDIYGPLEDMVLGRKYDFEEVRRGCCGTGLLEAGFLCNEKSTLCSDVNKYVFWDSVHPSERAFRLMAEDLRPAIDALLQN